MIIAWKGDKTVTIESKNADQLETDIVINPSDSKAISLPRGYVPHIITVSTEEFASAGKALFAQNKDALFVDMAGEYEARDVFVFGIDVGATARNLMFAFECEGVRVVYAGTVMRSLTDEQKGAAGVVDVLIVPVGAEGVLSATQAIELIGALEPRIVVPIAYEYQDGQTHEAITQLKKAFGAQAAYTDKLKLKKSDLPAEDTVLALLSC